jgi:putative transposase
MSFKENTPDHELRRQTRGLAILSTASSIKRINKLRYKVKSRSDETKWYDVIKEYGHNIGGHEEGEWTCSCPDFEKRHLVCKHIYAVCLSKELRRKIISQDVLPPVVTPPLSELNICDKCNSEHSIIKCGIRHNNYGDIQRYRCKACNHKFIINVGFEGNRADSKTVTAALDLYFKGEISKAFSCISKAKYEYQE